MDAQQAIEDFEKALTAWLDDPAAPERADSRAWTHRLGEAGLLAPDWAPEHGGLGLDRDKVKLLEGALRERGIRRGVSGGLTMLGPALLEYATPEQLERFLPPIARGEITWAQGYSEPQAGSDLANVQMRCEDQGDHYRVNGQKIWTSGADESDWIFCLVRTDPSASKHDGISFLLVDLRSPGIEISPIVLISGRSPFCQVFFSDVEVPKANLIGGEGGGWPIAKRLLQFERSMLGSGGLSSLTGRAGRQSVAEIARDRIGLDAHGRLRDDSLRVRVARQWVDERANRLTGARARGADAARVSSILKLASSEASQQRYGLLMDLGGSDALEWGEDRSGRDASLARQWLRSRANTIEGGTSEVQLDIIAKRVLGMHGMQEGTPDQSLAKGEDAALIRDAALQFLKEQDPIASLRGLRDGDAPREIEGALWNEMSALGWPGLLAPEEVGGSGLGFQELGVVFEALGRFVVPSPLLASGVLAASLLRTLDAWAQPSWASALAAGETCVAVALDESTHFDPQAIATEARRSGDGFELSGWKRAILGGPAADRWLVVARVDGDALGVFECAPDAAGVTSDARRWIDGRLAADARFERVALGAEALLGSPLAPEALIDPLVDRAAAALAAELAGCAAEALSMTVAYLKQREQFGQRLAGFQSLQHRCARAFAEVERTISLTQAALQALDAGDPDASRLASAAKALASETARHVTEEALQLHGGLGMTEEQDIGLYFKHARVGAALFGGSDAHLRRLAALEGI